MPITTKANKRPSTPYACLPVLANSLLATAVDRRIEIALSEELQFLREALHRFVCGGIYLYGGAPGSGKSLLACQIGLEIGAQGVRSLFIVTEQGPSNLKETATRITGDWIGPQQRGRWRISNLKTAFTTLPLFRRWSSVRY